MLSQLNLDDFDEPLPTYKDEPLLKDNNSRFVLFPIQYNAIWQAYKHAEAKFWSAEEIELRDDPDAFRALSGKEKAFVVQGLSILCAHPAESVAKRFGSEVQIPEARCFYGFKMMQENIHREVFTLLLQLFADAQGKSPDDEQAELAAVFDTLTALSAKSAWVESHLTESGAHFSVRNAALAIYLGIFSSSVFALMMHFARFTPGAKHGYETPLPGLIHGLCKVKIDYTHNLSFCQIVKDQLVNAVPADKIKSMLSQAVAIEKQLVDEIMSLSAGKLTIAGKVIDPQAVKLYVEYCANQTLSTMGYAPVYSVKKNPFEWIEQIMQVELKEAGFIQSAVKETPKAAKTTAEPAFSLDEDF